MRFSRTLSCRRRRRSTSRMPPNKQRRKPSRLSSSSSPDSSSATISPTRVPTEGTSETLGLLALLRKIDTRLDRMNSRLRKVETRVRTGGKTGRPKVEKKQEEEETDVGDVFPPITDVLQKWNDDRRALLKDGN